MTRWHSNYGALQLLEERGGPFLPQTVRSSFVNAYAGWSDVSLGAQMDDGTVAAVGLIGSGGRVESMPFSYGGVVASRRLLAHEVESLLEFARRSAKAQSLFCSAIPVGADDATRHDGGVVAGWSQAVYLPKGHPPRTRWAYKARRAIRTALDAGAFARVDSEPVHFLRLYRPAAESHLYRFPDRLIEALAATGSLSFYEVLLEGAVVSSVAALRGKSHWIAWLAAQDDLGRKISGNYLAVSALLEDAYSRGVHAVNLGISTGMPTVEHFKHRFDAVEVPVIRHVASSHRYDLGVRIGRYRRLGRRSVKRLLART
jgi:hypothetical protein